jgi:hypothetical protein
MRQRSSSRHQRKGHNAGEEKPEMERAAGLNVQWGREIEIDSRKGCEESASTK